jgi:hypothetical protein
MIIKILYVAAAVAYKLSPRQPTKQRALILILSVAPEFLEPIRSHFGMSNGMHDILIADEVLQCAASTFHRL